jgi:hypothetical protein
MLFAVALRCCSSLLLSAHAVAAALLRAGARALPGAPGERREAVDQPEGLAAWMRPRISTGQGWPVRNSRPPHAYPQRRDARRARTSSPSLWLLSLGHARESDSGSPKGWPKALDLDLAFAPSTANTSKSRAVQASDQDPTYAGWTARWIERLSNRQVRQRRTDVPGSEAAPEPRPPSVGSRSHPRRLDAAAGRKALQKRKTRAGARVLQESGRSVERRAKATTRRLPPSSSSAPNQSPAGQSADPCAGGPSP